MASTPPAMPSRGKWSFPQAGQPTVYVQIDMTSGVLSVGATPADAVAVNFNAYGTTNSFMLQGMNGLYVTYNGTNYVASQQRTGQVNYFALQGGPGKWQIV